jgi:hypothetical protein
MQLTHEGPVSLNIRKLATPAQNSVLLFMRVHEGDIDYSIVIAP